MLRFSHSFVSKGEKEYVPSPHISMTLRSFFLPQPKFKQRKTCRLAKMLEQPFWGQLPEDEGNSPQESDRPLSKQFSVCTIDVCPRKARKSPREESEDNEPLFTVNPNFAASQNKHDSASPHSFQRMKTNLMNSLHKAKNFGQIQTTLDQARSPVQQRQPFFFAGSNVSPPAASELPIPTFINKKSVLAKTTARALEKQQNQLYSFKREDTKLIFQLAIQHQIVRLPAPRKPSQASLMNDPHFCPYHRFLGHGIEDCFNFKQIAEKKIQAGEIILKSPHLVSPPLPHPLPDVFVVHMVSKSTPSLDDDLCFPEGEETNVILRNGKAVSTSHSQPSAKEKAVPNMNEAGTSSQSNNLKSKVDYNILGHLKKIPALLSVHDVLSLVPEMRHALVEALLRPEVYETHVLPKKHEVQHSQVGASLTFSSRDMLLQRSHNRPLYVMGHFSAYNEETSLKRILIDGGSAANLIPKRTLYAMGLNEQHLEYENVTISGFDSNSRPVTGSIKLTVRFDDLISEVLFYVINADTSYNALLGRPWIHENGIVPSTWHQCFKFAKNDRE